MLPPLDASIPRIFKSVVLVLFSLSLLILLTPLALPQQQDMDNMPGMKMDVPSAAEDPAQAAKRIADKRESELNHHLAGLFVIIAGIFILAESPLAKRWSAIRYVWPICFLAAGLFLLIYSDTEIWPFGPQTPWYAITHNAEVLQHKTFSIILLALGYVEFQRTRGRWKSPLTAWLFPLIGGVGAILLLVHVHSGDMHAPNAMESMRHIQKQHHWFAATGFGVVLTNGVARLTNPPQKWQNFFRAAWPSLLIILGILLTLYTE
jgi:putative copper resistance protein D